MLEGTRDDRRWRMIWPRIPIAASLLLLLVAPVGSSGDAVPNSAMGNSPARPGTEPQPDTADPLEGEALPLRIGHIVIAHREYDWLAWGKEAHWALYWSSNAALLASLESHSRDGAAREPGSRMAKVEFTVNREGRVSGVDLRQAFVHEVLDEAVMDGVRRAKLPPLPAELLLKRVTVSVAFLFDAKLDAAALQRLREKLEQGSSRGFVLPKE